MTMTSGLNRPRPTAAGRSICSSLISRVFVFLRFVFPTAAQLPLVCCQIWVLLRVLVLCAQQPRFRTRNPRIVQPTQSWNFVQSWDCGTLWVLFGTSLAILGLKLYEAPLPKGICNPRIAGPQSQSQVFAIPGKGSFLSSQCWRLSSFTSAMA